PRRREKESAPGLAPRTVRPAGRYGGCNRPAEYASDDLSASGSVAAAAGRFDLRGQRSGVALAGTPKPRQTGGNAARPAAPAEDGAALPLHRFRLLLRWLLRGGCRISTHHHVLPVRLSRPA